MSEISVGRREHAVPLSPNAAALAARLDPLALQVIARYPEDRPRSALLPLLHLVQSEEGYVSPAGVEYCAAFLGLTKAQVGAVATFYTMYKRRPAGEYLVSVCTNTLCNVLGGQAVYDGLVEHLGVGHDETTADGKITLEHAECLAACDYAPVMTVNYDFYDRVDPDAAVQVVEQLRDGQRPAPSRGARLCTLRETSLQLAGFSGRADANGRSADGVEGPAAGEPTLRGNRLAERYGIAVAGFDPNTPIGRTPDKRPAPAKPAADAAPADKAADAAPADKAADRPADKAADRPDEPGPGRDAAGPDQKSPAVRAAETRNPDAGSAVPDTTADQAPTDGAPAAVKDPMAQRAQERNLRAAKEGETAQ
jgi:NADH-quinone oxidoreductase subunit E